VNRPGKHSDITAAYMSPEQARGQTVDKRADIWSFGVVLWETLTGEQLFSGDTITDILAAVVRHEPEWERVPTTIRRLLRKCLEKDPRKRLRDIGDVWELLEERAVVPPTARPQSRVQIARYCERAAWSGNWPGRSLGTKSAVGRASNLAGRNASEA
jgi:serine/threonine protein kinase